MSRLALFAALSGAAGVAAGAFGAHAFSGDAADWLRTGGNYQLVHAVATLVALRFDARGPAGCFLIGSAIFAATLYAMALGAPRELGAITPLGGAILIGGWLWLAYALARSRKAATSANDTDLST